MLTTGMKGNRGTCTSQKAWRLELQRPVRGPVDVKKIKCTTFLESDLERELGLALRLPPDDKGENETRYRNDTEAHEVPRSGSPVHGQDAEHQDQETCRGR